MKEPLMKIGEVADYFQVSQKAIRLYEKKGIVAPARIDPATGYRYYTTDQINQINVLVELKALGFSLEEIKTVLHGGASNADLIDKLALKRMAWENAIAIAKGKIEAIDKISERLSQSKQALKLQSLSDEERAWFLAKFACIEGVWMPPELTQALWL